MAKSKLNTADLQNEQDKLNVLKLQVEEYKKAAAFIREWNKMTQDAKANSLDQLDTAKQAVKANAGLTKELKSQIKLVTDLGDAYDDQLQSQTKILDSFDDLDDTFTSILSKAGKNNKLTDAVNLKYEAVRNTVDSISTVLKNQNELSQHQVGNIVSATSKYKGFQSILAEGKGNRSQQEYNELVQQSYKEFDELFHKIDDSTEAGTALKERLSEARTEMLSFNQAAEKSEKTLNQMNDALDHLGSSGIPAVNELSNVLKSVANGGKGATAAVTALGAALGALAASYFGADLQAGIEAQNDAVQNDIDGRRDILKTDIESGFIRNKNLKYDKIGLELKQSQIENQNELNRLNIEAGFAGQRAANQFNASMQSGAAQFQAAAKTALFGNGIGSIGYGAAQMNLAGIGADQVASAMTAASDATGAMPTAKAAADMAVMAARTGQSVEGIASINEAFQRMDGVSAGTAMNMQEGLRAMAKQANINLGGLMTEMAESSKEMLGYQIKSGSALAKQVTFARSMGVSFQDIAKAGQSMVLNYKDSIKSEMQLSAMLGKNVDLSEVRSSFAAGDTEGALKALKAQGLDPAKMDMFQQQQLQQATGMDLTTLSKISSNTGKSATLGAGNATAGNQGFLSKTESAQRTLNAQEASISAQQAIIDAKLSQKITEAYLNSPGYLAYQMAQAQQAKDQAELNTLIQKSIILNKDMIGLKGEEKQLGMKRSLTENLLPTAGAIAGGFAGNKLMGLGSKLLPKAATAATGAAGTAASVAGTAASGAGMFGKLGKAGKFGAKLLGKAALPLALLSSAYDGFQGYKNANENLGIKGREATTGEKLSSAGGSILSGLTFGLADEKALSKGIASFFGAGPSGKGAKSPIANAAGVTPGKPGSTSVSAATQASQKWMQTKLVQMNGNLGLIVNRTQATMANTANTTNQLKVLNTNTTALMNLTTRIEALTRATYEGSTVVKVDGKTIAKASNKYTENLQASNPTNNTGVIGAVTGGGR